MARLKDEGGLPPRKIHSLKDLREAVDDGYEYTEAYKRLVLEEHHLCVAAFHRPGSLLCSRVRPTMFACRDYRRFWQAAEHVFELTGIAGFHYTAVAARMSESDVEMRDADALFVQVLQATEPVDAMYVERHYVTGKIAKHELARFQDKTKKLNDQISVDPSTTLFSDYISAAQDMGRTPGAGAVLETFGEEMSSWDPEGAALRIVPSGLDTIDGVSGGGPGKGDLVVFGGGTNAGKSFLGEQVLHSHATLNQPFLYVSIEDELDIMRCRILARHCVPPQRPVWIRKPPPKDTPGYSPKAIADARAFVVSDPQISNNIFLARKRKGKVSAVVDVMRRYRYEKGVVAVMVDYLQALTPDHEAKGSPNIVQETARKIAQLKEAADGLGVPIYLTSQLARDEFKNGAEPDLTSCKYAGDIENEAEIVGLLWRSQDQTLNAKIAKAKWVETTTPRYIIRCDKVSGIFGRWEPAFQGSAPQGAAGSGAPSGNQRRGGGRRDARQL